MIKLNDSKDPCCFATSISGTVTFLYEKDF